MVIRLRKILKIYRSKGKLRTIIIVTHGHTTVANGFEGTITVVDTTTTITITTLFCGAAEVEGVLHRTTELRPHITNRATTIIRRRIEESC